MKTDMLVLGSVVFVAVLVLIEGLRIGAGLLGAAVPASARLRQRLRHAAPAPAAASAPPKPPRMTEMKLRFIPLHMM